MKIQSVELCVSNFEKSVSFYKETMGFASIIEMENRAVFQVGSSNLILVKDLENKQHYYHFAINIPANLFQEAKQWLKERVTLLTEEGEDEVFFDGKTNAYACYFEDPSGNIVEFIARQETSPKIEDIAFSPKNVLEISEINFTSEDVEESFNMLQKIGIPVRHGDEISKQHLNFIGEYEDGAFILLGPVGRRWLFSSKPAIQSPILITTDKGEINNFGE